MASDPRYGGQAIIEGVMIRGARYMTMAVRAPDGRIIVRVRELSGLYTGLLRELPFVRGIIILWETLVLGMRALVFSSAVATSDGEVNRDDGLNETDRTFWISLLVPLIFITILFFVGPVVVTTWLERHLPSDIIIVLTEGFFRVMLLIGYIWLIGFLPDIRRVFGYHGAEHMAIAAWEQGRPLTVESVRSLHPAHPRCGTAFLLTVMIVSVLLFITLGTPPFWLRALSRVAFIPIVATIAYEIIRIAARYHDQVWARAIAAPSLALQRLTTRQPEDDQIEVAIAALQEALAADGLVVEKAPDTAAPSPH